MASACVPVRVGAKRCAPLRPQRQQRPVYGKLCCVILARVVLQQNLTPKVQQLKYVLASTSTRVLSNYKNARSITDFSSTDLLQINCRQRYCCAVFVLFVRSHHERLP